MQELTLRFILGDQLNSEHSWFKEKNSNIHYLMMEIKQELEYTTHHIQKISAYFLSMRNFVEEKSREGHHFIYTFLDAKENTHSLTKNLLYYLSKEKYTHFEYQLPDEYRLDRQLIDFCISLEKSGQIKTKAHDTEHFFTHRNELIERFGVKKSYLMESFYRAMRKDHQILMDGNDPEGKIWNLDSENRKSYDGKTPIPPFLKFNHSAAHIRVLIDKFNIKYLGTMKDERIVWPISRHESLVVLDFFVENLLPHFGTFEDAMDTHETALFHSRLSFALNTKMISPGEVIKNAIRGYREQKHKISFAQLEGFVRQILGWREFMRGNYWAQMPHYSTLNFFEHKRKLPNWYWTGDTKMNCLHHSISQSLELAYAHHIQRLMITGSFALLAGIHPDEVDSWYLGIYIDAIEWVEITNTRGMSQYADGGIIGSKPYVSGANYISKMSNYCKTCIYDPKKRHGEKACPFNSLYWNFFLERKEQLIKNQRVSLVYRNLEKMENEELKAIQRQAQYYLKEINQL